SINSIGTNFNYTRNVNVVDVDGDGDWDVVAAADTDGDISWFENDGSEGFTEWPVSTSFGYAYFVSSADMDGDGDMDIVGTAQNANQLAWWENDLAEEILITGTNPGIESYYSGDVTIDFANGFSDGNTSVFFNQGDVPNKNLLGTGVDHVAQKGFYTITTAAITYDATIVFSYAGITGWSPINDENDLIIVYFDPASGSNGQWVIANGSS
ncbi:MAG: hypothetical protein GY808_08030, partial [Gammaproteobacteria bacterium]|nr:hypothetical protein [Gammaproteobacteria bacterium]